MRSWSSVRASGLLASLVALLGAPAAGSAQGSATIRGTVTDSVGSRPIAGVQVVVGPRRSTLTDEAGRYTIRVPAGQLTVRAQRLGFAAQEQRVTAEPDETVTADFFMRTAATLLAEVVVTGYGTASRAQVTSAVAQVSGAAVRNNPVGGVDAALQGKAPGVQVLQNAGNPGNGITVRIRGASSIEADNQPLYVVDGLPIVQSDPSQLSFGGQDLTSVTSLSADEIESIDILKDGAAAAIYGSRGSNGVIQITTRRGRPGRTRFSFNAQYGRQTTARKLDLLNAVEYVEFLNEGALNDGYGVPGFPLPFVPGVDDQVNFDWQSAVMRAAPVSNYNLTVSGGPERITYMLSGSLFDQEGVLRGSGYGRANGRLNVDFIANSRLSFRTSIGVSRERWQRIESDSSRYGTTTNSIANQPNIPARRADGSFTTASVDGLRYPNPLATTTLWEAPTTSLRTLGSVDVKLDVTDRLRLTGRVGADISDFRENRWQSPLAPDTYADSVQGVAGQGTNTTRRYLTEGFITFDPIRSPTQQLALTAGTSVEFNRSELTYHIGETFGSDSFQYPSAAGRLTSYDAYADEYNLLSFFARASYALRERYFLSATVRADGSSRFGPNSRYGYFPSVSAGWVATQEPFLAALKRVVDLKLRASYGETGNQGISDKYAHLGYFKTANFANQAGIAPQNLQNPDLKWETTRELDVGFDMAFLGGRLALIGDYYDKLTSDLLVARRLSAVTGYASVWDNIGNISNRGVEFQVSTTNIQAATPGAFDWRTDFNVSHNRNRVTRLHRHEPYSEDVNRVEEGVPIGAYHMYRFLGVDPQTGNAIFDDANGDGVITPDDFVVVGSPHPDFWGGLRNQLSWKGFDLNAFLEFSQGFEVYNGVRLAADDGGWSLHNKVASVRRRWRNPGDVTDVPRASYDGLSGADWESSRFIEDGSYLRLQEVTLGYRLPRRMAARANFADARVYLSGRNLMLWTPYTGYDPDVNSAGSNSNVVLGQDFYAYPRARTISIGISGTW
jgi:TonB-linked SusC/RagA family outer membrane protein